MSDKVSYQNPGRGNKAIFGLIIIIIGLGILLKQLGILPLIHLRETWPLILIVIGLFVGVQKKFRNNSWWILILIGAINLVPEFTFRVGEKLVESDDLIVPAFLIIGGLIMILKPKRCSKISMHKQAFNTIDANVLNSDVVFGGRKEVITAKDFKGGSVTATFGGVELNMLQADSVNNVIELYTRATFGGIEIIVPSHWEVKNEIETIMGSVEDHRILKMADQAPNKKILILKGTCFCGGIEIKSF